MTAIGTARAAIFRGTERGFTNEAYEVPEPAPGQALLGRYHLDGRDAVKIAVDPWAEA